jgi:serine/threonine-protein kinase
MAPEQILGDKVDHRADIYCLGLILFEMFTGEQPFVADTVPKLLYQHATKPPTSPSRLRDECPPELRDLIMKCLEKAPDDRPKDMAEIQRLLTARELTDPAVMIARRSRTGAVKVAVAALAVGVLGVTAWYLTRSSSVSAAPHAVEVTSMTAAGSPQPQPTTAASSPQPQATTAAETPGQAKASPTPAASGTTVAPASPRAETAPAKAKGPRKKKTQASGSGSFFDLY